MKPSKIEQFAALLFAHPFPADQRGRKSTPFITDPDGGTRFPASRAAYIRRLHHFKILTAVDHASPCIDSIAETKCQIGSVRRTLWLYFHDSLPEHPEKQRELTDLLATHNATLLIQGIEKIILRQLQQGRIGDSEFANNVLDDKRLMTFAQCWFTREKGQNAISYDTRSL